MALNIAVTIPLFFKRDYFCTIQVRLLSLICSYVRMRRCSPPCPVYIQENTASVVNVLIAFTFVLLEFCFPSTVMWWPFDTPIHVVLGNAAVGSQPLITLAFPLALQYWREVHTHSIA
jgi:hypothetical protein